MDFIRHRGADEEVDDTKPPRLTPGTKNALDDLAFSFGGVEISNGNQTPAVLSPRRSPRRAAPVRDTAKSTESDLLTAVLAKAASSPLPAQSPTVGAVVSPKPKQDSGKNEIPKEKHPLVVRYKRTVVSREGTPEELGVNPELIEPIPVDESPRDDSDSEPSESFVSANSRFSAAEATAAVLARAGSLASQSSFASSLSSSEKPQTSQRGSELKAALPHSTPTRKTRSNRSTKPADASRLNAFAAFRAERREGLQSKNKKDLNDTRPRAEVLVDFGDEEDTNRHNNYENRHDNKQIDALADQFAASTSLDTPSPRRYNDSARTKKLNKVGLCYSDIMELHAGPPHHFERPARHAEVVERLKKRSLDVRCEWIEPREARNDELLLVHSSEHLQTIRNTFNPQIDVDVQIKEGEQDIFWTKHTEKSARYAAGCVTESALRVAGGTLQKSFAVVRPPGHHAECQRAMGFCFFNNTVVAARSVLKRFPQNIKKVLILDWDVHHGNGIQDITYENSDIMYVSLHRKQPGFYPETGDKLETGSGQGLGFNVNIPWFEKGLSDADYVAALDLVIEPIAKSYKPDLVIIAAGYDAAEGDPLGGMKVSDQGYALMTDRLGRLADGRMVVALEGGYGLTATANAAAATLSAMLGFSTPPLGSRKRPRRSTVELLTEISHLHSECWPVLKSKTHLLKLADAARVARGAPGLEKSPKSSAIKKVVVTAVPVAPGTSARTATAS